MISVIVPIYNVADYLIRCLDSLMNQTYRNYEVVLIDDGSDDNSGEIAHSYAYKYPNVIYIHQQNKGQGAARNAGSRVSKGDCLEFVDADDYVHPNFLLRLHELMTFSDADISICSVQRVWDNGRVTKNGVNNDGTRLIEDVKDYLIKGSFSVCNKLYKKHSLRV